jgi:transposase
MTKTQVEVITSVQRRRRWPRAEKERIAAAALEPGAVASEVARAAGIHTTQLFRWRQQLCKPGRCEPEPLPAFNAVALVAEPGPGDRPSRPDKNRPRPDRCERLKSARKWATFSVTGRHSPRT